MLRRFLSFLHEKDLVITGVLGITIITTVAICSLTIANISYSHKQAQEQLVNSVANAIDIKIRAIIAKPSFIIIRQQDDDDSEEVEVVGSAYELNYMACMAMAKFKLSAEYIQQIHRCVVGYAKVYDLPEALIYAVIEKESGFNQYSKSHVNCHGLMQVKLDVWEKELKIPNAEYLYNVDNNIKCGCYILSKYIKIAAITFPDSDQKTLYKEALKSYFGKCDYAERYAHKVLAIKTRYRTAMQ